MTADDVGIYGVNPELLDAHSMPSRASSRYSSTAAPGIHTSACAMPGSRMMPHAG